MDTVKVKIIKTSTFVDSYDDYYTKTVLYPATVDWEEVTYERRNEIAEAVQKIEERVG